MSDDEKTPPDPEPDYTKAPEAWRAWRKRGVDKHIASGQETGFGFWRTYYEDLQHGPPISSNTRPVEVVKSETSRSVSSHKMTKLKDKWNAHKKGKYVPIAERDDPQKNIFRLAAESKNRKDSYPVGARATDLVSFGLLPEPALQPYLDLIALYLHMTHFRAQNITTQEELNLAFENWATHFNVAPMTKTALVFEDYVRPEDYKWLKQEARKDEASVLEWVARCRWATATLFKHLP